MNEDKRQKEKEETVLLALNECKALIRRELAVYTMDKSGNTEMISESKEYEYLWGNALSALKIKQNEN